MAITAWKLLAGPRTRPTVVSLLASIALPVTSCIAPGAPVADPAPLLVRADTAAGEQFVVIYRPGRAGRAGRPVTEQDLRAHYFFLIALYQSGLVTLAGPFLDDTGGMLVLRARDAAEAAQTVASDPAVVGNVMRAEVRPFRAVFEAAGAHPSGARATEASRVPR